MSNYETMYFIYDEDNKQYVGMSEKRDSAESNLLRMKVSAVLKDFSVKESDFYDKIAKVRLVIKERYMTDDKPKPKTVTVKGKKQDQPTAAEKFISGTTLIDKEEREDD